MNRNVLLFFWMLLHLQTAFSYTRYDTLRGSLNPYRSCYDVYYYDLKVKVTPSNKSIIGQNKIYFKTLSEITKIQVELFNNLLIDSILHENKKLAFQRDSNFVFISFPEKIDTGQLAMIEVFYRGQPKEAIKPPWDGGFVWSKDSVTDSPWVGVACEGIGASLWWPCKDHSSDEPDSMRIRLIVPEGLTGVSNGKLKNTTSLTGGFTQTTWQVSYPINLYNVTLNVAKYAHLQDVFTTMEGKKLALDYYVLTGNAEKASKHFTQVKPMLTFFEKYFGEYPFVNDGYKLVEAPYWGMEHQSCVAYGNGYKNNEFGFDFIILHESAHEYWGNSVSCSDHGELWIHEAFATYTEALYLEHFRGREIAIQYLLTQKEKIKNKVPILGPIGVNYDLWPDADMYYKGTWMLHTLRNMLDDDDLWFDVIKRLYQQYKYSHITTEEVTRFLAKESGMELTGFFRQYLKQTDLPVLEMKIKEKLSVTRVEYKWKQKYFNMPLYFLFNDGTRIAKFPDSQYQTIYYYSSQYIDLKRMKKLYLIEADTEYMKKRKK